MTPVEIMALIVVVVSIIKLIVVLINPKAWVMGVGHKLYSMPRFTMVVCAVLAAISFCYLIKELTIVQIFASFLLFWFLLVMGLAPVGKELLQVVGSKYSSKSGVWRQSWLLIIIWVVLLVWALKELFM